MSEHTWAARLHTERTSWTTTFPNGWCYAVSPIADHNLLSFTHSAMSLLISKHTNIFKDYLQNPRTNWFRPHTNQVAPSLGGKYLDTSQMVFTHTYFKSKYITFCMESEHLIHPVQSKALGRIAKYRLSASVPAVHLGSLHLRAGT